MMVGVTRVISHKPCAIMHLEARAVHSTSTTHAIEKFERGSRHLNNTKRGKGSVD